MLPVILIFHLRVLFLFFPYILEPSFYLFDVPLILFDSFNISISYFLHLSLECMLPLLFIPFLPLLSLFNSIIFILSYDFISLLLQFSCLLHLFNIFLSLPLYVVSYSHKFLQGCLILLSHGGNQIHA